MTACKGVIDFRANIEQSSYTPLLGKIIHITGGDLWLLDLDTHRHTRLTHDGYNRYPRWSTDGHWIAYLKQGSTLYVMDLENQREERITDTPIREFAWSPLENRLFYLTDGVQAWRENKGQGSASVIGVNKYLPIHFAPNQFENSIAVEVQGVYREIRMMDLDSTEELPMYKEPYSLHVPHLSGWSPDGLWLLVWVGPQSSIAASEGIPLCTLPARGGQLKCISEKVLMLTDFVSWSFPHQLALIAGAGRETWINKGLAWMNPEDMKLNWLVKPEEQAVSYPAWSPDGQRIVYSASPFLSPSKAYSQREAALAGRRIWLMDFVSGRRSPLTRDERYRDERPLWSADGQHILFARISETGASLWLMEADGDSLQQVVDELTPRPDPLGDYGYIDWSAWYDWWHPGVP